MNKTTLITILAIVAVIVATYMVTRYVINVDHVQYEQRLLYQIDSLDRQIISIQTNRGLLDNDITMLNDSIIAMADNIAEAEARITELKYEYDKKLNGISKYSTNDITRYFAERYDGR